MRWWHPELLKLKAKIGAPLQALINGWVWEVRSDPDAESETLRFFLPLTPAVFLIHDKLFCKLYQALCVNLV